MDTEQGLQVRGTSRGVVAAAGTWLDAQLIEDGFRWIAKSRRLERETESLVHQVHFQPSKFNRTAILVKVNTMLNVRDPALRRWRRNHPGRVVSDGDFVCGHLLGYASGRTNGYVYGEPQDGDIDLTDPARREAHLLAFVALMRNSVLPWFAEASDPEQLIASRAGDYTNDPSAVVEWLASRNRADLITPYADRYLARNQWAARPYSEGVAAARSGQLDPRESLANTASILGWSATRLTEH